MTLDNWAYLDDISRVERRPHKGCREDNSVPITAGQSSILAAAAMDERETCHEAIPGEGEVRARRVFVGHNVALCPAQESSRGAERADEGRGRVTRDIALDRQRETLLELLLDDDLVHGYLLDNCLDGFRRNESGRHW